MSKLGNFLNFSKLKEETQMKKGTIIMLLIAVFVVGVVLQSYVHVNPVTQKAPELVYKIGLKEVELFYSPESRRVLLLDRKTENVKQILEQDLSTALFAVKAAEITTEFNKDTAPKELTVSKNKRSQ